MKYIFILILLLLATFHSFGQQTILLDETQIEDAWIWSWPNAVNTNFGENNPQNQGLHNVVRAESWQWTVGQFDTIRSLLRFDLSSIPHNAVIDSAFLSLYFFANPNFTPQSGNNALEIKLVTGAWDESQVTWSNKPTFSSMGVEFPASTSSNQDYPDMDITTLIDTLHRLGSDYGILLKMKHEDGFNGLTFASTENSDSGIHPSLRIIYSIPNSVSQIAKVPLEMSFSLTPNPSTDKLVAVSHYQTKSFRLYVLDMSGKEVWTESIGSQTQTIDLSALPAGNYIVRTDFGASTSLILQ